MFKQQLYLNASILLALAASSACYGPTSSEPAEVVLTNGIIHTMDRGGSQFAAVAAAGGRIVYLGSDKGVARWTSDSTKVIDLKGRMVLPGFHDSHVHPATGGIELAECNLNDLRSAEEVLEEVKRYAAAHPDLEWIRGGGWDLPLFPNANPDKRALDEIVPDRPVYLTAADGHSAWVNSKALEKAGVTSATPDPSAGRIERDAAGNPSGTLRETAMGLVEKLLPPYTAEDYAQGIKRALAMANRVGITSLQEASANELIYQAYRDLEAAGQLNARVVIAQRVSSEGGPEQIPELLRRRDAAQGERVRAFAAKFFVDGVIEAHTAALLEPYVDQPSNRGVANFEPEQLNQLVTTLDREGFQVHFHAIGDRGVRMALDACQAAKDANGASGNRHHISHLELIDTADIPRFKQLEVIANFQPLWAYADTYITQLTEPVLGPVRSRWLYPMASVQKAGARVAAGSDWSVSSMNPLAAIQIALTRQPLDNPQAPPWIPEELMQLDWMLKAYTTEGAFLNRQEELTGSLELGKAADMIVLDRNLFEIPASEIYRVKVLLTLLEGKEVYRDPEF